MHIIKSATELSRYLTLQRTNQPNVTIGFVATMGALHQGHVSLINASTANHEITVCSIFVNPTQFGEKADLDKYPKPIENDIKLLKQNNCSVLFLPSYEDVYPKSYQQKEFSLDGLDTKIEGASRPGHYQGVCNVVSRFFSIIKPNKAYFGQKDFQQTVVVKKMADALNLDLQIVVVPIKREKHGLAMSSRNIRLSQKGRQNAAFIYKALLNLKDDLETMSLQEALSKAKQFIASQKNARIDYLLAVDTNTLEPIEKITDAEQAVVLTVVEYENVRLLDNIILN